MSRGFLLAFAFLAFFPYPALSIGNNTGLQASEILALATLPLLLINVPSRAFYAYVFLIGPRLLSAFVALIQGESPEPAVIPKELLSTVIALGILLPSAWVIRRDLMPRVLMLAALAILFHVTIGLIQLYSYTKEQFPLLYLYKNPSFKPMAEWADIHAIYIKRPFGLFPEPSAMSASIGPWMVLFGGLLTDPEQSKRLRLGPRVLRLLGISLLGGFGLFALSRSGLVPIVLGAVMVLVAQRAYVLRRSLSPRMIAAGLLLVTAALGAIAYVVLGIQSGLDARIESSWGLRSMSIVAALTANQQPVPFLFGVGPGQSTETIRKMLAHVPLPPNTEDLTVWSVSVGLYMESGILGALGMLAILLMILRAIVHSSSRLLGLVALAVWFAGVTVTTSYTHLPPIWLFLGLLLEWDRVFPVTQGRGVGM